MFPKNNSDEGKKLSVKGILPRVNTDRVKITFNSSISFAIHEPVTQGQRKRICCVLGIMRSRARHLLPSSMSVLLPFDFLIGLALDLVNCGQYPIG